MGAHTSRLALSQPTQSLPLNIPFGKTFYKVPPELWAKIVLLLDRRDLASLALTSRTTYPLANPLLYQKLEVSFGKCSQAYMTSLLYAFNTPKDPITLVDTLILDLSIPCQVWWYTSFVESRFKEGKTRKKKDAHPPNPGLEKECSSEMVKMVYQLEKILPRLTNLQFLTLVVGHFDQDPALLHLLLDLIPPAVLCNLTSIKLGDLGLVGGHSLSALSSLRCIDLGYVSLKNAELRQVLTANCLTLEDITLHWIIESSQVPFFDDFQGLSLSRLKSFTWKGYQACNLDGLRGLLKECHELRQLRAESLGDASALIWAEVLTGLALVYPSLTLHVLALGAPSGNGVFWTAVSMFIRHIGVCLEELTFSGSGRHSCSPYPPALQEALLNDMPTQYNLTSLVFIWRDGVGPDYDTIKRIGERFPSLQRLHLYLQFPAEDNLSTLMSIIKPFTNIRHLYLVFPVHVHLVQMEEPPIVEDKWRARLRKAVLEDDDILRSQFLWQVGKAHPTLQRVSWGLFDHEWAEPFSSFIVQLTHTPDASVTVQDRSMEAVAIDLGSSYPHLCTLGTKRFWASQKSRWREKMGNVLFENRGVCEYADFAGSVNFEEGRKR